MRVGLLWPVCAVENCAPRERVLCYLKKKGRRKIDFGETVELTARVLSQYYDTKLPIALSTDHKRKRWQHVHFSRMLASIKSK